MLTLRSAETAADAVRALWEDGHLLTRGTAAIANRDDELGEGRIGWASGTRAARSCTSRRDDGRARWFDHHDRSRQVR
jgi:hypothetical protein